MAVTLISCAVATDEPPRSRLQLIALQCLQRFLNELTEHFESTNSLSEQTNMRTLSVLFMKRRSVIASAGLFPAVALAGCQEQVLELLDQEFEAEAEPAIVDETVVENADFEHVKTDSYRIDREFEIGGATQHVTAGNWVSMYRRPLNGDDLDLPDDYSDYVGMFGVVTSPTFEIAGQSFNPADALSDDDLVEGANREVDDVTIQDIELERTETHTILDESVDVNVYSGVLETDEGDFDGTVHVARVEHEGDLVVTIGGQVQDFDLEDDIYDMKAGVRHPVDEPTD